MKQEFVYHLMKLDQCFTIYFTDLTINVCPDL